MQHTYFVGYHKIRGFRLEWRELVHELHPSSVRLRRVWPYRVWNFARIHFCGNGSATVSLPETVGSAMAGSDQKIRAVRCLQERDGWIPKHVAAKTYLLPLLSTVALSPRQSEMQSLLGSQQK